MASQNEAKRSGDCQVLHQRKKKRNDVIFKMKSLNGKPNDLKNLGFMSAKLFKSDSIVMRTTKFSIDADS